MIRVILSIFHMAKLLLFFRSASESLFGLTKSRWGYTVCIKPVHLQFLVMVRNSSLCEFCGFSKRSSQLPAAKFCRTCRVCVKGQHVEYCHIRKVEPSTAGGRYSTYSLPQFICCRMCQYRCSLMMEIVGHMKRCHLSELWLLLSSDCQKLNKHVWIT